MRAMFWTGVNTLEERDIPIPEPRPGWVLLKVLATGVCRTDYHIYSGQFQHTAPPCVLGHEICGRVEALGEGVTDTSLVGRRFVVETSIGCGRCHYCRTGRRLLCKEMMEIGYAPHQGGYAEYVTAPAENLIAVPDPLSDEEAAITESAVCPFGALMRVGVRTGEAVFITGAGPAAIAFVQAARIMGAGKIYLAARNEARLRQAASFGADGVISLRDQDLKTEILRLTDGEGAGLLCEATGASPVIASAFEASGNLGRIILYGIPGARERVEMPVTQIILKQTQVFGAVGSLEAWEPLLAHAAAGRFRFKEMVTDVFPLPRLGDAFALMERRDRNPIKCVVKP